MVDYSALFRKSKQRLISLYLISSLVIVFFNIHWPIMYPSNNAKGLLSPTSYYASNGKTHGGRGVGKVLRRRGRKAGKTKKIHFSI